MQRRSFLSLGAGVVGATAGYLAWRDYRAPDIPDGMSVESMYVEGSGRDIFADGEAEREWTEESPREHHTIISDKQVISERIEAEGDIHTFVAETEFATSYLLIIQNEMQSAMELELDAIERTADDIRADVSIDSPLSAGDDANLHTLLLRITDEHKGTPTQALVDIDGYV